MHCFYVENSQFSENSITITGDDVNHMKNVLRMNIGERVKICDGEGKDYYCEIASFEKNQVIADIMEIKETESELPAKIYLFQGLPKKDKMELIIQKSVELGVYEVIPVNMKRCVAKIEDGKKEKKKLERWQSISTAAAKQSGRGIIPKVHSLISFKEALAMAKEMDIAIVPYELADHIEKSHEVIKKAAEKKSVAIFIGPEGGFDEKEIQLALEEEFDTITLGKRILRTETAGLTILSILMFQMELNN